MLMRLLREKLARYRGVLVAVVVFQSIQTALSLYLPTPQRRHHRQGRPRAATPTTSGASAALMLVVTLVQVLFAIAAVYFGARAAMGFGRDVRRNLFHQVTAFSAREVGAFGAPSLITRITNDVQQVQMLVLMTCTTAGDGADHDCRRRRAGAAPGRRPVRHPHRQHPGAVARRRVS